jgi:hypothetical protein
MVALCCSWLESVGSFGTAITLVAAIPPAMKCGQNAAGHGAALRDLIALPILRRGFADLERLITSWRERLLLPDGIE